MGPQVGWSGPRIYSSPGEILKGLSIANVLMEAGRKQMEMQGGEQMKGKERKQKAMTGIKGTSMGEAMPATK